MKKITAPLSAALIAALLMSALTGCRFVIPAFPQGADSESKPGTQTEEHTNAPTEAATEPDEGRWNYVLTIETTEDTYYGDDGTLFATVTYERPVLELAGDPDAVPPAAMQNVCDIFNRNFDEIYDDSAAETHGKSAEETYREIGFGYTYEDEIRVLRSRVDGDLVEVELQRYIYAGGAHGGSARWGCHFDLREAAFFTLADLTDDDAGLARAIAEEVIRQIDANDAGTSFFDGYEETIRNKEAQEFTLGENALTVIFGEYEITPYSEGIQEFEISYDIIRSFLNARGERLLLSPR